jgi:hypothetical protein
LQKIIHSFRMHVRFTSTRILEDVVVLYSIRKGLGKWKLMLWPIVISIAASSLTMISRSKQTATVLSVNGDSVSYKIFTSRLREFQEQVNMRRNEARSRGIPVDFYLQLSGLSDPMQSTLDVLVRERTIDAVLRPLWLSLHDEVVSKEILKSLPADFLDASGNINMELYRRIAQAQQLTVVDIEDRKEEEMQRSLFDEFVKDAAYLSSKQRHSSLATTLIKKSFSVVKLVFDAIKRSVSLDDCSNAEKESFYESNKENYRVAESRSFAYWVVSPSVAEKKVTVSEDSLVQYYQKNKNTMYRIPPRVKVRHILISAEAEGAKALADDLFAQISKDHSVFEKLAQEHSADKDTAHVGGVRDFFSRGTYDKAFEQAAFRLKNAQELAPVTKVDAGFEIIQLVERIPATEKAFAEVKQEIEETVRAKKAMDWIRTHLEKIKKDASANQDAIKEITSTAESHKEIKAVQESKANSHSLEGLIVKNGFTLHAIDSYSYFTHNDAHVLVQLKAKEGSYIQPYKEVVADVERDLLELKAKNHSKELAQSLVAAVRAGASLKTIAQDKDLTCETSDFVQATDENNGIFKGTRGLLKKAFGLTGPDQVVLHFVGNDAYLVTLHDVDQTSAHDVETALEAFGACEDALNEESSVLSQAFISSLLRNARVEFDQKLLSHPQQEESVPYDI